jgi:hypothetical protein
MSINERLAELRECAQADGIKINEESVRDFLAFPGINVTMALNGGRES